MIENAYASTYSSNPVEISTSDPKICYKTCYDKMKTDRNISAVTMVSTSCYCVRQDHDVTPIGNANHLYANFNRKYCLSNLSSVYVGCILHYFIIS